RVVAEAEEALGRVVLVERLGTQEGAAFQQAAVVVLGLVVVVLGRRLADGDLVATRRSRVAEETERRKEALGRVVANVGRDHVLDLAVLVEEHEDAHQAVGVALVGVGDDLRHRDEAHVRTHSGGGAEHRGERERDQLADRSRPTGWWVSSHRSPTRSTMWNGPGTRPAGVTRRRCGSEMKAIGFVSVHRRANSPCEMKSPSRSCSRYVGGVKSTGSRRGMRRLVEKARPPTN